MTKEEEAHRLPLLLKRALMQIFLPVLHMYVSETT